MYDNQLCFKWCEFVDELSLLVVIIISYISRDYFWLISEDGYGEWKTCWIRFASVYGNRQEQMEEENTCVWSLWLDYWFM